MAVELNAVDKFINRFRRNVQSRSRSHVAKFKNLFGVIDKQMCERRQLEESPRRPGRAQGANHEIRVNHQPHAAGPPAERRPLPPGFARRSIPIANIGAGLTRTVPNRTARQEGCPAALWDPGAKPEEPVPGAYGR